MKMIIDWDKVVAMSEEIDSGDSGSLGTKKRIIDLDDLYSIGKKLIKCREPREYTNFSFSYEGRDLSWKID